MKTDKHRTSPLPLYAGRFRPKWQGTRFERNRIGQVHSEEHFRRYPHPGRRGTLFADECGQDTNHQVLLQNGKTRGSAV